MKIIQSPLKSPKNSKYIDRNTKKSEFLTKNVLSKIVTSPVRLRKKRGEENSVGIASNSMNKDDDDCSVFTCTTNTSTGKMSR